MDRSIAWKLALAFAVFAVLFVGLWVLGGVLLTSLLSPGGPDEPSSDFPDSRRTGQSGTPAPPDHDPEPARIDAPPDPSVERLISRLSSPDYAARKAAEDALVSIGSPAVPSLERALASPDAEVRWRAKETLRRIQEK